MPAIDMEGRPIADRADQLLLAIAGRSVNGEHGRAIDQLNARLHAARTVEPHVLDKAEEELAAIASAATSGERDMRRRLSLFYHRRQRRAAADIVRAVYRVD